MANGRRPGSLAFALADDEVPTPFDQRTARPGPVNLLADGTAPQAATPLNDEGDGAKAIPNVVLVFLPSGAEASEAIPAANHHVYLDLEPDAMTALKTDGKGVIKGPTAGKPLLLDGTRDYHIVVSPTALAPVPSVSQGTTVRVSGGKISVTPHIAIHVVNTASTPVASLACVLTIGTTSTNVTTSSAGWIVSQDTSAGAVTVRSNTRSLSTSSAGTTTAPQASLSVTPASPTRGASASIDITPPAAAVGFKVTEWKYDASHTNPGNSSASTATITRPTTESPTTFDQKWEGILVTSGTARARFVVGATVRASGDAAVNATVTASDPVEVTLSVTVARRTNMTSTLVENAIGTLTKAITSFHDLGQHEWNSSSVRINSTAIASGPNRGCEFTDTASVTFTSTPKINSLLNNASSAFSLAQDKAYLTDPTPVRVIPRNLYDVGPQGAVQEKTPGAIANHFGIGAGQTFTISNHCIDQARLLAGTKRHESEDTDKSHKTNCLRALRALEPVVFAEALVKLPGETLNFRTTFQARVNLVVGVSSTHDVVDEAATRTAHAVQFVSGQQIEHVNADASGTLIGPVWNPTTNSQLT